MAKYADEMIVDKQEQLEKIERVCLPDETIRAVFDLKSTYTGFLGITDKRIIYYDKAFLKHSRIASVASEDNGGLIIRRGFFVADTLTISPMGLEPKTFEFRGGQKAHKAHNIIMEYLLSSP